tara:strand:+ start:21510 stop:21632 length:123 start_codon:yes stop_codon:yes gene_type:complete
MGPISASKFKIDYNQIEPSERILVVCNAIKPLMLAPIYAA